MTGLGEACGKLGAQAGPWEHHSALLTVACLPAGPKAKRTKFPGGRCRGVYVHMCA